MRVLPDGELNVWSFVEAHEKVLRAFAENEDVAAKALEQKES